jgi:hypothetical protein
MIAEHGILPIANATHPGDSANQFLHDLAEFCGLLIVTFALPRGRRK